MASRPSQYFYDSLLHVIGWFFLFFYGNGGGWKPKFCRGFILFLSFLP